MEKVKFVKIVLFFYQEYKLNRNLQNESIKVTLYVHDLGFLSQMLA